MILDGIWKVKNALAIIQSVEELFQPSVKIVVSRVTASAVPASLTSSHVEPPTTLK
jgi:hypothetical protein